METEQGARLIPLSKRSQSLQPPIAEDAEEGSTQSQKGLNFAPLLRTLQRKALLIVIIAGLTTSGAIAYVKLFSKRSYQGDFRLLVEPVTTEARIVEPAALARAEGGVPSRDIFSLDYPTQLEILQSPEMLTTIVNRVRTRYPAFTFEEFKRNFLAVRVGTNMLDQTKIIEVRYIGSEPQQVLFVLEETAKKYLKYSLDERKTRIGEGIKFIEDQLPSLTDRVEVLKSQLQQLQQQQKLTDPAVQGEELFTLVREIENQELETQRLLQEQRTLYANLQRQLDLSPNEAIAASALSEEPQYKELLAKVKEVEGQIALESARFKALNPYVEALERKRNNLLTLLNQETQRILGQSLGVTTNSRVMAFQNSVRLGLIKQLVDTANQIQVLEVRSQAIGQARANLNRQAREFPTVSRKFNEITQQLEVATRTRDQLLSQRESLRVQLAQNQLPWEVVSKPRIPTDPAGNLLPIAGKAKIKVLMGGVGGLFAGVVLALVLEKWRNIFYTPEDVKDGTQLPLLGVVPKEENAEQPLALSASAYLSGEETAGKRKQYEEFVEAFDSLYTNIRFLFPDRPVSSLAISSATSGDGKSMVALHLAEVAALAGQRVLLVDANFHEPNLHLLLDLPNFKGLSDVLCSQAEPLEAVQRSLLSDNLFLLTAGRPVPGAARRLASSWMQRVMEELETKFDLVIYDTPALAEGKDANFIASHADGILMIVAIQKTKQSAVKHVLNQLENFGIPCLGVVANHIRKNAKNKATNKVTSNSRRSVELSTAPQDI